MIRYLKHSEINMQLWNATIAQSNNELIYAYSWYLDVVCNGWEALVLNNYEAIMPLTHNKKFTLNYLFNPFFVQQLGVFSNKEISTEITHRFIEQIPHKFKFVEINLNSKNPIISSILAANENQNFELNLNNKYESLYNKYATNTKRNLKKANGFSLQIMEECNLKNIVELFRNDRGATVKNLRNKQYLMLENLLSAIEQHTKVLKLGVMNVENNIIAGAIFIFTKRKLTFLFSGNSDDGKKYGAMFLLIDFVINKYCNQNITLDFEGSNQLGLANFYKGFGATNIPYFSIKINQLPPPLKFFKS